MNYLLILRSYLDHTHSVLFLMSVEETKPTSMDLKLSLHEISLLTAKYQSGLLLGFNSVGLAK